MKMSAKVLMKQILYSVGISGVIGYLFYDSFLGILFSPITFLGIRKWMRKLEREKQRRTMTEEFCEALRIIKAGVIGGYSLERAFLDAERELRMIMGEQSVMCKELRKMNQKIAMNQPLELVVAEFAEQEGIEEIEIFSEVLNFAKRSSGDLIEILDGTIERIHMIEDTEREVEILVTSRKYEQKLMMILPLIIILYLKVSFKEYILVLYGNVLGICFMTICILVYFAAVVWGQRLLRITV